MVYVAQYYSYSGLRPNKGAKVRKNRRKVEPSRVSVKGHPDNENESMIVKESDAPEDVVATDKYVKVISQLPINNRKENIKVIAHDDNSVTISFQDYDGMRCTNTSCIPYNIDFETSKATYKNGILEFTVNRNRSDVTSVLEKREGPF